MTKYGPGTARYGPFKCVLAGEGATGKTSLLQRVKRHHFDTVYHMTIGGDVVILDLVVNHITARLFCWDSAGQSRFACIRQAFYRGMKGFIIVYDISWRGSFERSIRTIYILNIRYLTSNIKRLFKSLLRYEFGQRAFCKFSSTFKIVIGENCVRSILGLERLLRSPREGTEGSNLKPTREWLKSGVEIS